MRLETMLYHSARLELVKRLSESRPPESRVVHPQIAQISQIRKSTQTGRGPGICGLLLDLWPELDYLLS